MQRKQSKMQRKQEEYQRYVDQYFATKDQDVHQDTYRQIHIGNPIVLIHNNSY